MLVAGYWLLGVGDWVLVTGYWLLGTGCWSLVIRHWFPLCWFPNIRAVENNCKSFKAGTVAGMDLMGRVMLICSAPSKWHGFLMIKLAAFQAGGGARMKLRQAGTVNRLNPLRRIQYCERYALSILKQANRSLQRALRPGGQGRKTPFGKLRA